MIRRRLGSQRPVAYEDTVTYFKIHLAERYTWVMCRLYLGRKRPSVWVPLPLEQVQALTPGLMLNTPQAGWTCITLTASGEIERLGDVLCAAWDSQKAIHSRKAEDPEAGALSAQEDEGGDGLKLADVSRSSKFVWSEGDVTVTKEAKMSEGAGSWVWRVVLESFGWVNQEYRVWGQM